MTLDERVDRVPELGYTERESRFLAVAGSQRLYFLRSSIHQSTGAAAARAAPSFTAKLLRFDHASVGAVCHNAHLFHLHAKPLYERWASPKAAIGASSAFAVKPS